MTIPDHSWDTVQLQLGKNKIRIMKIIRVQSSNTMNTCLQNRFLFIIFHMHGCPHQRRLHYFTFCTDIGPDKYHLKKMSQIIIYCQWPIGRLANSVNLPGACTYLNKVYTAASGFLWPINLFMQQLSNLMAENLATWMKIQVSKIFCYCFYLSEHNIMYKTIWNVQKRC